jgi:hypothetical protein
MVQQESPQLHPFLRDASASFIPELTDDQLMRIAQVVSALHPDGLLRPMTDLTPSSKGSVSKLRRCTKPMSPPGA